LGRLAAAIKATKFRVVSNDAGAAPARRVEMKPLLGLTASILIAAGPLAWGASDATPTPLPVQAPPPVVAAPPLPGPALPSQARIYVYREDPGYLHPDWTAVWFNDVKVGDAAPGTFFYRDVQPGSYRIGVNSDIPYVDQYHTVTVAAGGMAFVKVYAVEGYGVTRGVAVMVTRHGGAAVIAKVPGVFGNALVDATTARKEIPKLRPAG
jgi:hypothetical protein